MWWIGDTSSGNYGPERSLRLLPFKSFVSKGIRWGGGSDYPVTPIPPRYGLWASVAREPEKGVYAKHPFGTAESVDIRTALRSYTIWAANQIFMDDRLGSIEPGKIADLAVWDQDMYSVPTADIKNLKCAMTIVGGEKSSTGLLEPDCNLSNTRSRGALKAESPYRRRTRARPS